jgi:hypothetical protein
MQSGRRGTSDEASDAIAYYADRPAEFIQDFFDPAPVLTSDQIAVCNALSEKHFVAVGSGHGCGKTALLAMMILWFMTTHNDCRVVCTAPALHTLADKLWPELHKWLAKFAFRENFGTTASSIYCKEAPDTWFGICRTSTKEHTEAFSGFHEGHILLIGDEASGLPEKTFEPLLGATSTPGAYCILASQATRKTGTFVDALMGKLSFFAGYHMDLNVAVAAGFASPDYELRIAERYGRDSDVYRVRVQGLPPRSDMEQLIPTEWVESAMKRTVEPKGLHVIGLDVAGDGPDDSVLMEFLGYQATFADHRHGVDTMGVAGWAAKHLQVRQALTPFDMIRVDANGIGAGVCSRLRELRAEGKIHCHVDDFISQRSAADETYSNMKTEAAYQLRAELEAGNVGFAGLDSYALASITRDLTGYTTQLTSSGVSKLVDPDDSPDWGDATLMATYRDTQNAGFLAHMRGVIQAKRDAREARRAGHGV